MKSRLAFFVAGGVVTFIWKDEIAKALKQVLKSVNEAGEG